MHHRISAKKLNVTSSHRKAMLKNMANSLITHEQISTTLPKAKALRPYVEKLITLARDDSVNARRNYLRKQNDKNTMRKIFAVLGPRYKSRSGGYLRIMKAGFRYGDRAPMALIEFVERNAEAKGVDITTQVKSKFFSPKDSGKISEKPDSNKQVNAAKKDQSKENDEVNLQENIRDNKNQSISKTAKSKTVQKVDNKVDTSEQE